MKVKVKKAKKIPAPIVTEQAKNKTPEVNNDFVSIDLKAMYNNITAPIMTEQFKRNFACLKQEFNECFRDYCNNGSHLVKPQSLKAQR